MTVLTWQRAGAAGASHSRPVAVLLHGWGGRGQDWEATGWTAELTRAGHDVLVPDLPGHASSAAVSIPEGVEPAAWTAATILDDLGRLHVKQAAVVGYDGSCPIVGHLAVRAPSTVLRVVLVSCDDRRGEPQAADAATALRNPRARIWHLEVADLVRRARSDSRHDPYQLATWLERAMWPAAARLGALETPVLIAVGTEDSHRGRAPGLAALFGDARLVTAPGDDQSVLAAPALLSAVLDFLSGVDLGRTSYAP